jgi:hypothetical protein
MVLRDGDWLDMTVRIAIAMFAGFALGIMTAYWVMF